MLHKFQPSCQISTLGVFFGRFCNHATASRPNILYDLYINQLHFIMHRSGLYRFCHSYILVIISHLAHLVARFVVKCHFVAMYLCSVMHAPQTVAPWLCLQLASSCQCLIEIAINSRTSPCPRQMQMISNT